MQDFLPVIAISGTLAVGSMSPGPSFLFVAHNAVALSRRHGYATALGMGSGACIFSVIALLGIQAVFTAVPILFWLMKVAGGCYLLYLASRMLRAARKPLQNIPAEIQAGNTSLRRAYCAGLFTQLSNPKTAIVFAGVFSALLPQHIPLYFYIVIPVVAFCIDAGWYLLVAFLLSADSPKQTYLNLKPAIDSTAGLVMGGLGIKLILNSR